MIRIMRIIILKHSFIRLAFTSLCISNTFANTIDLQSVLDNALKNKGADVHVTGVPLTFQCDSVNNGYPITISSGKISNENNARDLPVDAIYQIGSETKSFVAVIALQLADEINPYTGDRYFGKNGLDSTVGQVLSNPVSSETWNATWNNVTLRQLLNMTSHIPDYIDGTAPNYTDGMLYAYSENPYQYFSTEYLLSLVAHKPLIAQGWEYSNTNYLIMGKIITKLTGKSIEKQITDRIINKIGLMHTYYVKNNPLYAITNVDQQPLLMSGYYYGMDGIPEQALKTQYFYFGVDVKLQTLSWAKSAGSMISTTTDINAYIHALFTNKAQGGLLTSQQLNQLTSLAHTKLVIL